MIPSSDPGIVRRYGITQTPVAYDPPISSSEESRNTTVSSDLCDGSRSDCVPQAEPARKLANIAKVPVLFVTTEAGYHAVYQHCTVEYMRQADVSVEWLNLPDFGSRGNVHFMFMDKNNLEIAEMIEAWAGRRG